MKETFAIFPGEVSYAQQGFISTSVLANIQCYDVCVMCYLRRLAYRRYQSPKQYFMFPFLLFVY